MKVCTDACILGAYTAGKFTHSSIKTVLDIGCGTGLLGLMIAQKTNADIEAIEIEREAAEQARENINRSSWSERINVIKGSLLEFQPKHRYDLIVCNPPFYEGDLKSPHKNINAARHDSTLTLKELFTFVAENLSDDGAFILLLPFHRSEYAEELLRSHALFVNEKLSLRQTPGHVHFRAILVVSKVKAAFTTNEELVIHDSNRNYSAGFESLLKDYYLNF